MSSLIKNEYRYERLREESKPRRKLKVGRTKYFTVITLALVATSTILTYFDIYGRRELRGLPDPPKPEPIDIFELPLPPVTLDEGEGGCTHEVNPRGTGCIGVFPGLQNGNFLPDGNHVVVSLNFSGASASSIFTGLQLVLIKGDESTFPNGDPWKCITCGVPESQQANRASSLDYPQAFRDGTRILAGRNIIDCGPYQLASAMCTPDKINIYPIHWNIEADSSGTGGAMRELRIHPDNVHLGFSAMSFEGGSISQFGYFARLDFNPYPTTGIPRAPRYDLVNVTRLFNPQNVAPLTINGDEIILAPHAIAVGEIRGFTGSGREITYVGASVESCNIDVFAADLTTGMVRRLTNDPEYVDPIDYSYDDEWYVVMDTLGTDRQMFIAGMRGIPPLVDLIVTGVVASIRNNGHRRFFKPWLIDRYGQRGDYSGQQINAGDGAPGSVSDPQWNGMADPKWSPDGTRIAYWQQLTHSPACGGTNPLPCPKSTADGGRYDRIMIAHLSSRKPKQQESIVLASDVVPWGVPYVPGSPNPTLLSPKAGIYTLMGKISGSALVDLAANSHGTSVDTVAVAYQNYSNDGIHFINGSEEVSISFPSPTLFHVDWYSNLTGTGKTLSSKRTGKEGFHLDIDVLRNIFVANGTLTTIVDGIVYKQPLNYT
jgi:hypothetical protein